MPTGKKNKKSKRQWTCTGEFTDGDPGSHRSVDQPPPLSLSLSGPSPAPDNTGARHDHGDWRESPDVGSNGRTSSSPLPALMLSDRNVSTARVHRPLQPTGPDEKSSQDSRDSNASALNHHKPQRAMVEDASDEDDRRQRGPRTTGSTHNDRRSESRNPEPDDITINLAVVPPTPNHGPRSTSVNTASDRSHRLTGSSPVLSSSPYPLGSVTEEPENHLRESEWRARREGKQRRSRADSIESAELHLAATRSLRRRAAWAPSEKRLRDFRVEEDRIVAEELYMAQLRESQDRDLAERLQNGQDKSMNVSMDEPRQESRYTASEKGRSSTIPASVVPDEINRMDHRRRDVRPLLAPGRDPLEERSEEMERRTHTFHDRVILQRFRYSDLAAGHTSRIPDQGIDWDESGTPFEKGPAPSQGSSVGFGGKREVASVLTNEAEQSSHIRVSTPRYNTPASDLRGVSHGAPLTHQQYAGRGSHTESQKNMKPPVKHESGSPYYSRPGTTPQGGRGSGSGRRPSDCDMKGGPPSDSSSSTDESDSHSDESDPTYQPERNYSQSEETDSAWEQDPSVTIEEVTLNASESQPS
ncbi:hypothetical protein DFH09DRAFT_1073662 [Mycena vulgaris]|nr:hypothetical protein DFH09DRAFT_1073662 [Mycena vulgaris]